MSEHVSFRVWRRTEAAFVGSALENFHCILRCGLKSFSGTKRMTSGDVYGEGVYLSSDPRIAHSFSSRGCAVPPLSAPSVPLPPLDAPGIVQACGAPRLVQT